MNKYLFVTYLVTYVLSMLYIIYSTMLLLAKYKIVFKVSLVIFILISIYIFVKEITRD